MALATARVTKPDKRKGHATAIARPFLNIGNNGGSTDTLSHLRLQRLSAIGLTGLRARLVASLAWEAGV